jgi:hypothetical protein
VTSPTRAFEISSSRNSSKHFDIASTLYAESTLQDWLTFMQPLRVHRRRAVFLAGVDENGSNELKQFLI